MPKLLPLILVFAAISLANANASDTASAKNVRTFNPVARDQDESFNVFFRADRALLTPEGREIVSEAAKRFVDSHDPNARVFVISNTSTGEELPIERADAVKKELEHDGIKPDVIGEVRHSRAVPASLQEWQNRRIIIAIRANSAFANAVN